MHDQYIHIDHKGQPWLKQEGCTVIGYQYTSIKDAITKGRKKWASVIVTGQGSDAKFLFSSLHPSVQVEVEQKILGTDTATWLKAALAARAAALPKEQEKKLVADFKKWRTKQPGLAAPMMAYYKTDPRSIDEAASLREKAFWLIYIGERAKCWAKLQNIKGPQLRQMLLRVLKAELPKFKIGNDKSLVRIAKPFEGYLKMVQTAKEDALHTLINKKRGNKNSVKVRMSVVDADLQVQQIQDKLIELKGCPAPKLSDVQVHQAYMKFARQQVQEYRRSKGRRGWSEKSLITARTVTKFLDEPEVKQEWFRMRHESGQYNNQFEKLTRRRSASYANALWVIDGTPWHRYYMKDGYAYQRINVFVVLDAHSWAVVGFYVSASENTDQVLGAMRSACLLSGCLPKQILSDNSSPIKSARVRMAIREIAEYGTTARPGNARTKKNEPFFKHINDSVLKFRPGYTGNPFAKLDTKANKEVLQELIRKGNLPDYHTAIADLHEDFTRWNNTPFAGAVPIEKYWQSVKETQDLQIPFTAQLDRDAFWFIPGDNTQVKLENGKKHSFFKPQQYTFGNGGIEVHRKDHRTGERVLRIYDTDLPLFNATQQGKKFELHIEPERMEEAHLYQDGKPYFFEGKPMVLTDVERLPEAIADRTAGDGAAIAAKQESKKQQEEIIKNRFAQRIERLEKAGLAQPDGVITWEDVYGKPAETERLVAHAEALNPGADRIAQRAAQVRKQPKKEVLPEADEVTLNRMQLRAQQNR